MIAWKKDEKLGQLHETKESETWKQRLGTERRNTLKSTAEKILELESKMREKNDYLHHFKNDKAKS